MPEMHGFSLFEVAICILTAADDAYYKTSKKKHPGINGNCVIHKPVDNESLLRQIKLKRRKINRMMNIPA